MREQKKYLIIYHKEDNDGVFSAAIIYDYLLNKMKCDLTDLCFIGADYNMLAKFAKDNNVEDLHADFENIIMTDISFNDSSYMKSLWEEFGNNFIWIDHHAPIIKESYKHGFCNCPGIRDTQRSAILNAWKFLYDQFDEDYNQKKVPELFRILSAYDSWSYEREGYDFDYVRNINKGTTIKYNLELGKVKKVVQQVRDAFESNSKDFFIDELHDFGKSLNEYDDIVNKGIIETSGDTSWQIILNDEDRPNHPLVRKCCVIFHQGATNSMIFKSLCNTDINNGAVFKHQPNGNWVLSLYNINNDDWFHCGDFLKEKYNGGGHKGAAGCTLTQDQFITILKNKIL